MTQLHKNRRFTTSSASLIQKKLLIQTLVKLPQNSFRRSSDILSRYPTNTLLELLEDESGAEQHSVEELARCELHILCYLLSKAEFALSEQSRHAPAHGTLDSGKKSSSSGFETLIRLFKLTKSDAVATTNYRKRFARIWSFKCHSLAADPLSWVEQNATGLVPATLLSEWSRDLQDETSSDLFLDVEKTRRYPKSPIVSSPAPPFEFRRASFVVIPESPNGRRSPSPDYFAARRQSFDVSLLQTLVQSPLIDGNSFSNAMRLTVHRLTLTEPFPPEISSEGHAQRMEVQQMTLEFRHSTANATLDQRLTPTGMR